MSEGFERDIQRRFEEMGGPEDPDAMISRTVGRAMGARRRRRQRRMSAGVVAAALMLAGGAFALTQSDDPPGRLGPSGSADAPARRAADPQIAGLPWLYQADGAKTIDDAPAGTGSLRFPAGVTYEQAARSLYVSVLGSGELPADAQAASPLPRGIVAERSQEGVRISLAAPFGYEPDSGRVRVPTIDMPGSLDPAEAERILAAVRSGDDLVDLPAGAEISWPAPPGCQVIRDGRTPAACPAATP